VYRELGRRYFVFIKSKPGAVVDGKGAFGAGLCSSVEAGIEPVVGYAT
jgi:hypothetical protein